MADSQMIILHDFQEKVNMLLIIFETVHTIEEEFKLHKSNGKKS